MMDPCESKKSPLKSSIADEWEAGFLSRSPSYLHIQFLIFVSDRVTFSWLSPLIVLGAERPLLHEDLGSLHPDDRVGLHLDAFTKARNECEEECRTDGRNATAVALARHIT